VDGRVALMIDRAAALVLPMLKKLNLRPGGADAQAFENARRFRALMQTGSFCRQTDEDSLRLKRLLIEIYENDLDVEAAGLKDLLNAISLPDVAEAA
jgi:hypothetical protein